ncbi:MAG: hypothetical protein NTX22_13400 [Ignavibacteriales bacterium]|nr:hypothetical protein [Ignavibacteriales bacterium]
MKTFYKILFLLVFSVAVINAQEKSLPKKDGEAKNNEEGKTEIIKKENPDQQKFIDENGDGINDTKQGKGMKKRRGKTDTFVDKDGDGINDNRCQGMGWGKGKQKGFGKHPR